MDANARFQDRECQTMPRRASAAANLLTWERDFVTEQEDCPEERPLRLRTSGKRAIPYLDKGQNERVLLRSHSEHDVREGWACETNSTVGVGWCWAANKMQCLQQSQRVSSEDCGLTMEGTESKASFPKDQAGNCHQL